MWQKEVLGVYMPACIYGSSVYLCLYIVCECAHAYMYIWIACLCGVLFCIPANEGRLAPYPPGSPPMPTRRSPALGHRLLGGM